MIESALTADLIFVESALASRFGLLGKGRPSETPHLKRLLIARMLQSRMRVMFDASHKMFVAGFLNTHTHTTAHRIDVTSDVRHSDMFEAMARSWVHYKLGQVITTPYSDIGFGFETTTHSERKNA